MFNGWDARYWHYALSCRFPGRQPTRDSWRQFAAANVYDNKDNQSSIRDALKAFLAAGACYWMRASPSCRGTSLIRNTYQPRIAIRP